MSGCETCGKDNRRYYDGYCGDCIRCAGCGHGQLTIASKVRKIDGKWYHLFCEPEMQESVTEMAQAFRVFIPRNRCDRCRFGGFCGVQHER